MERVRLSSDDGRGGDYFPAPSNAFIKSGCTTLDCGLGGGWALGRMANIVGDKAVGKTLLAIEACANFARDYPDGHIWYREAEAAFDLDYAGTLGLPIDRVDFGSEELDTVWNTIEEIFADLKDCIKIASETGKPGLYIVDSLDALSSVAELARKPGDTGYHLEKPKMMSALFRQLARDLKRTKICVIIISQIRDNIGVMFGEKSTRVGGRALDFFATHIVWLYNLGKITRTVNKVDRVIGVKVRAKIRKNKIGAPHRESEFSIHFGYGVEDFLANMDWLDEVNRLDALDLKSNGNSVEALKKAAKLFITETGKLSDSEYFARLQEVEVVTRRVWGEVEASFAPSRSKYR